MKNFRNQNHGLRALTATLALLLAMPASAGDVVTYVHADHLGSPVAETNSLGQVTRNQVYSPYGETHLSADGDTAGFTGHRNDADTGLVYMQARYYDPISGRFLSTDPVTFSPDKPEHFNRYWYGAGSPLKFVDPNGKEVVFANNTNSHIQDAYNNLVSSSESAAAMFAELEQSSTVYTIGEAVKSGYNARTKRINIALDPSKYPESRRKKFYRAAGLTEDEQVSTINGENKTISLEEKISHEGSHALDDDRGLSLEADDNGNGLEDTEERASQRTNQVREEMGIEGRRDTYQGVPIE